MVCVGSAGLYRRQRIAIFVHDGFVDHWPDSELDCGLARGCYSLINVSVTTQAAFIFGCNLSRFILKIHLYNISICGTKL